MGDELTLAGRVAIVTGAANGLGRAEALALARAGARLVLNDLPGDAVQAVAAEIRADGGQAVVAAGDVGAWATGENLLSTALGEYGRLDVLVNNAGVLRDRMIFSMSEQEWDTVIRVHLRGHFVTTRLATAYWREASKQAGGPVYGRIVNTSSEAFLLGSAGQPNYAAAKAGIAALTVTTARSCARYGVRANAICPRARTAMTAGLMGPAPGEAVDPLAPEHVAPLVVYLAGPAAEPINGEVFVVHGGVAAVLEPPRIRAVFQAAEHGSPDSMWTLESVHAALSPAFGDAASATSAAGFACEDTLALATETIGFPARDSRGPHRAAGPRARSRRSLSPAVDESLPRCPRFNDCMVVIFGFGAGSPEDLGAVAPAVCPNCHNQVFFHHVRSKKSVRLYFVPVVPYGTDDYLVCPVCSRGLQISRAQLPHLRTMAAAATSFRTGRISQAQYQAQVEGFWRQFGVNPAGQQLFAAAGPGGQAPGPPAVPAQPAAPARPPPAAGAAGSEPPWIAHLRQLAQLHDQGVLSDADFEAAKQRVLEQEQQG